MQILEFFLVYSIFYILVSELQLLTMAKSGVLIARYKVEELRLV